MKYDLYSQYCIDQNHAKNQISMENRQILTALSIRRGIATFTTAVDNSLFKKKQRKCIINQEQLSKEYTIFNFFMIRKEKLQYFIMKEQLKGFAKNYRNNQDKKGIKQREIKEDISQFKVLQDKIVGKPRGNYDISHKRIKNVIVKEQIRRLFCQNEVEDRLQQIKEGLQALKLTRIEKCSTILPEITGRMRRIKNRFEAYFQVQNLRLQIAISGKTVNGFTINRQAIETKIHKEISFFIDNLFRKLLQAVKLRDLLARNKIKKKWDSDLLLKDQQTLIGKKIKGKLLYSVQQDIRKGKNALQAHHVGKQYSIRQKKNGIHQNIINKSKNHPQNIKKGTNPLQFDQDEPKFTRQPKQFSNIKNRISTIKEQVWEEDSYGDVLYEIEQEKPKSKSQLVEYSRSRYIRPLSNTMTQPLKIKQYDISNISQIRDNTSRRNHSSKHKFRYISQQQQTNSNIQRNNPYKIKRKVEPTSYNYSRPIQKPKHKQQSFQNPYQQRLQRVLKFPIKIQSVQIYSPSASAICYHLDDICLKELSLKFIQDRLKYRQNRVKIYYPFRFSKEEEEKVIKSMQILSCLGAQVCCEAECSYQNWNEIDEIDVVVVSWMLQVPLREVVNYYCQYISSGASTKK